MSGRFASGNAVLINKEAEVIGASDYLASEPRSLMRYAHTGGWHIRTVIVTSS